MNDVFDNVDSKGKQHLLSQLKKILIDLPLYNHRFDSETLRTIALLMMKGLFFFKRNLRRQNSIDKNIFYYYLYLSD